MIETLAPILVANFLLPYAKQALGKVAEKVGEQVGQAAGEEAASTIKGVWQRVSDLFRRHPEHEAVLKRFESDPEAKGVKDYLETVLEELLRKEPELARELDALVKAPAPGTDQTIQQVIVDHGGVSVLIDRSTLVDSPVTVGGQAPPPRDR
jgi:hypothetical protein